jgi:hypothetical protein
MTGVTLPNQREQNTAMSDAVERSLSDTERQHLTTRLEGARAESRRAMLKTAAASAAVCGPLMLLTLWLSDAPAAVVVGFWSVITLVFTLWIGLPWRRLMRGQIPILEDALDANRARDIVIRSERVVEFEEEEDEGACYAFDRDGASAIFVIGQEFYEDDDFPNSDFSMTELLGRNGQPVDWLLTKRGRKLTPERVVPASIKNALELPDHLEIVAAPLERVESALRRAT